MNTITIVTSTLNCEDSIRWTISSLLEQTIKPHEWVVVDGLSSDRTAEIVLASSKYINVNLICEIDGGIYEAWNKALNQVSGEWVLFLGAGDRLASTKTLELAQAHLQYLSKYMIVYGNVFRGDVKTGALKRNLDGVGRPLMPHHQAIFHNSNIFMNPSNRYDESYRIAADYKFNIPYLKSGLVKYIDLDVSIVEMNGISNNQNHVMLLWAESNQACLDNGLMLSPLRMFLSYIKAISRIVYFKIFQGANPNL